MLRLGLAVMVRVGVKVVGIEISLGLGLWLGVFIYSIKSLFFIVSEIGFVGTLLRGFSGI